MPPPHIFYPRHGKKAILAPTPDALREVRAALKAEIKALQAMRMPEALSVMADLVQSADEKNWEAHFEWVASHPVQTEQLALDAVRMLGCSGDQLERISRLGFFQRCRRRFQGTAVELEVPTPESMGVIRQMAARWLARLIERDLLPPHLLINLKNDLIMLELMGEMELFTLPGGTRHSAATERDMLVEEAQQHIEAMSKNVGEPSPVLAVWLGTLAEESYLSHSTPPLIRLLHLVNDFYEVKREGWQYADLLLLRDALSRVGIDPGRLCYPSDFVDVLINEILGTGAGFKEFAELLERHAPPLLGRQHSQYVVENISSVPFIALHVLKLHWQDRLDLVEELQQELGLSMAGAIRRLMVRRIRNLNVDMGRALTMWEMGIEILSSLRLVDRLAEQEREEVEAREFDDYLQDIIAFPFRFLLSDPRRDLYIRGDVNAEAMRIRLGVFVESVNLGREKNILSMEDVAVMYDSSVNGYMDCEFALTTTSVTIIDHLADTSTTYPAGLISEIATTPTGFSFRVGLDEVRVPCRDKDIRRAFVAAIRCTHTMLAMLGEDAESVPSAPWFLG